MPTTSRADGIPANPTFDRRRGVRSIIGLASGSGADGVDAALLEIEGERLGLRVRLVTAVRQPYARDLREMIRRAAAPDIGETRQLSLLHRLLGETFAAAARQVADRSSRSLQKVQCIGCPGHTVWHEPDGRFPSTLMLGMPAVVAERTGVTTVSDFRSRDVAAGGQGAPLSALVDYLLFRAAAEDRILIHLGGLARVIYLPARGRPQDVIGFEAGPCNLLLDGLMRRLTSGREEFDPGGKHGVQGRCVEPLLERWSGHPYLHRRPPKSVPRPTMVEEFITQALHVARQTECSLHDVLCTATHFVASFIAAAVQRVVPKAPAGIFLSGGGTRNGFLWHLLEQRLAGAAIRRTDALGIAMEARKAVGFGVLAALTLDGVPGNLPAATGAAGSRLLGSMTPGSSSNWARCLAWMATQTAPPAPMSD
jgi:anhydro-N-acetylmuramic acid kinase